MLFYLWDPKMHVGNMALIRLSYFTPRTCPSFSSPHLFPTFISSLRFGASNVRVELRNLNMLLLQTFNYNRFCTVALQEVQWKFPCKSIGQVEGIRIFWAVYPSWWSWFPPYFFNNLLFLHFFLIKIFLHFSHNILIFLLFYPDFTDSWSHSFDCVQISAW